MTETTKEDDFTFGDYDVDQDETVVSSQEALAVPDTTVQDDVDANRMSMAGDAPRNATEAIALARKMMADHTYVGVGYCLKTVRTYYGVGSKYETATESFEHAAHKRRVSHGTDVPRGVPVYWTGGSHGYGHIALSIGGGLCISTDWSQAGYVSVANIDEITSHWGLAFQGYALEVNDVEVWTPPSPVGSVSLKSFTKGAENEDVLQLKAVLHKKGYKGFIVHSKVFGEGTLKAYAKYQERLGFSGKQANGIPGVQSLRKLGFNVV